MDYIYIYMNLFSIYAQIHGGNLKLCMLCIYACISDFYMYFLCVEVCMYV